MKRVLRLERHPLGTRLHVFGARIHEWHLGAGILAALTLGATMDRIHVTFAASLAALAGVWLVAKDWHDLVPSRRDTAAWKLGLHRRPHPLRTFRRADPLPTLAAVGAIAVAIVNLVSAVTPNVAWRGHALLAVEPLAAMRLSHALAIPVAWTLLVTGFYLGKRRNRALRAAIVLLLVLALLNIAKGLDVEEAVADLVAAALLWLGRSSFYVRHEPLRQAGRTLMRVAAFGVGCLLVAGVTVWIAAPHHTPLHSVVTTTANLLLWRPAQITFHDELSRLGLAVGLLGVLTVVGCASMLFRPLMGPRRFPDAAARRTAAELVRLHGSDTLAYFKLRRDKHYLFSPDGTAFVGYRIENGVLLVSGDPVGPDSALPGLLRSLGEFAEKRGLSIAALGVSERLRPLFEQLGLRSLYVGDEALIDTSSFSLEGRAIRKVRQSVSRLEKAGFAAELHAVAALDSATLAELERVSEDWLRGAPERGFSMAFDGLRGDTLIVVARDDERRIRGFLHFVPAYGRAAVSLSAMRRHQDTPNGLTEFLVVRAIELLRERDIDEVSLNFAAFARLIHEPRGVVQTCLRRGLRFADRFFQIESLYRFNAKFFPRWEPRYFLYDGLRRLPRAGLAALRAEGQLPRPALFTPRRTGTLSASGV